MEDNSDQILVEWEICSKEKSHGLCTLMQQGSLVDVLISCGTMTMQAHKCVLAAHSNYLKNQFEAGPVDQIVFNDVDFSVVKSLVEFIYYGMTKMMKIHSKHFFALVKLFEITSLEVVFTQDEFKQYLDDNITIPLPQFICYPSQFPNLNNQNNRNTNLEVSNLIELPAENTEIIDNAQIIDYDEILTIDKLNSLLKNNDVEILFQTRDGINIDVRNEVDLMNLAKFGLQYSILDETGKFVQVNELEQIHEESQVNDDNQNSTSESELCDDDSSNESEISSTMDDLSSSETDYE